MCDHDFAFFKPCVFKSENIALKYVQLLNKIVVQLSKQYKGIALVAVFHEEGLNAGLLGVYYVVKH